VGGLILPVYSLPCCMLSRLQKHPQWHYATSCSRYLEQFDISSQSHSFCFCFLSMLSIKARLTIYTINGFHLLICCDQFLSNPVTYTLLTHDCACLKYLLTLLYYHTWIMYYQCGDHHLIKILSIAYNSFRIGGGVRIGF